MPFEVFGKSNSPGWNSKNCPFFNLITGGEKTKGGVVLTSREDLIKGGETGSAWDPAAPSQSLLVAMMSSKDDSHQMPPAGKRPRAEVEIIERWLSRRAPFDPQLEAAPAAIAKEKPAADSASKVQNDWWAYRPVIPAADPSDTRYAVDLLAGRIPYCHLKDWVRSGEDWMAAAVGDAGNGIDFNALLPKTNYHGTYLIEYEPLADTREGIARSLAHLQSAGFALAF